MVSLIEQQRASRQLHAIADKIEGFTREFHGDATKGTGIDELVEQAKVLIHDAASRTPLMGAPAGEAREGAEAETAIAPHSGQPWGVARRS